MDGYVNVDRALVTGEDKLHVFVLVVGDGVGEKDTRNKKQSGGSACVNTYSGV